MEPLRPIALFASVLVCAGWVCSSTGQAPSQSTKSNQKSSKSDKKDESADKAKKTDPYAGPRERMVQRSLIERGIKNARVLQAFRTVPRHKFLPPDSNRQAYEDESIPIGHAQTLTAPYEVAFMTEVLDPQPTDKVYEVGTGSGFQAAILSRIVKDVYSVEIVEPLSKRATAVLKEVGYDNVHTRFGDGYEGWPDAAPFDAVIVTCSPSKIPQPLIDQLKEGGRMVIPIGNRYEQELMLFEKKNGKLEGKTLRSTLFVPMTGKAFKEAQEAKAKAGKKAAPKPDAGKSETTSDKKSSKSSAPERNNP